MQSRVICSLQNHKIMAEQIGIIQFKGRLTNLLGTTGRKKNIIRQQNFVTKERIRTDPEYERTRRHISEFKGVAMAVADLMDCFDGEGNSFGGRGYRQELMKRTMVMLKKGAGVDGERTFESGPNKHLLRGMEMNRADRFKYRFGAKYTLTVNNDRNQAVLTVPSFVETKVKKPLAAEWYIVKLYVGVLSDLVMGADGKYESANPNMYQLVDVVETPPQDPMGVNAGFTLTATLPGSPILPSTAVLVVSASVEFYNDVNGNLGLLAQGNGLRILDIV